MGRWTQKCRSHFSTQRQIKLNSFVISSKTMPENRPLHKPTNEKLTRTNQNIYTNTKSTNNKNNIMTIIPKLCMEYTEYFRKTKISNRTATKNHHPIHFAFLVYSHRRLRWIETSQKCSSCPKPASPSLYLLFYFPLLLCSTVVLFFPSRRFFFSFQQTKCRHFYRKFNPTKMQKTNKQNSSTRTTKYNPSVIYIYIYIICIIYVYVLFFWLYVIKRPLFAMKHDSFPCSLSFMFSFLSLMYFLQRTFMCFIFESSLSLALLFLESPFALSIRSYCLDFLSNFPIFQLLIWFIKSNPFLLSLLPFSYVVCRFSVSFSSFFFHSSVVTTTISFSNTALFNGNGETLWFLLRYTFRFSIMSFIHNSVGFSVLFLFCFCSFWN